MLNVTSKSENETFLKLHKFVSLLKLESSRNVTSKVISKVIALKQGNQNPWNNMIASCSFASTADITQCRSNYLTQRAKMLTRRSSLTPQRAKNTVNDLSVVSVVPKSLST